LKNKKLIFLNPTFSARQITWRSLKWLQVIERDYVWWFKKKRHIFCARVYDEREFGNSPFSKFLVIGNPLKSRTAFLWQKMET
jgi:hypothetical protein